MAFEKNLPLVTRTALAEPWNRLTVSSLSASAANSHPRRAFIADCKDREVWDGNLPRSLTFADFQREVTFFAGQLETLGLQPGDRALILMANTVEAAIAIAGCQIAGLTPALAPLDENIDALRIAAERIAAAAIITTARVEELKPAEIARQIAARVISIRCVAAFGFGLPDGVIALDGWSEQDISPNPNRRVRSQEQEGLITFSQSPLGFAAHLRTEAQLIADALGVAARHKLDRDQVLVGTLQPAGSAWVAASFLMPLFLGATVQLVGPFTVNRLMRAVSANPAEVCLFCNAELASRVEAARGRYAELNSISTVVRMLRPGSSSLVAPIHAAQVTTLIDIDERALLALAGCTDDVAAALDSHVHPMQGVLAEGQAYLMLAVGDDEAIRAFGFAAAEIILRASDAETAAA
ncbi:FC-FACS_FadD_like domain containing protein [Rhabdaerophilaceae bacterium]